MESKLSQWCNGLIEAGWLATVIAIPLFFNIHSERVFEPDKLALLRSLALIMAAVWLVKFVDQRGWQRRDWLRWRHPTSIWRLPFVLPVALLVVIYLLSTAVSVTPRVSWAGSYQRLQGTYTTLSYIVIFSLTIATMRTRAQLQRVITAVIITSIPVAFYGLLQRFDLDPLPWGGDVTVRVAGHMGNAIFVAAYLIMVTPLTLARIMDAFTRILRDDALSYADVTRASVYIFTLAIQLLTIFWSASRGPWIGLAVSIFAMTLIVLVSLRSAVTTAEQSTFRLADAGRAFLMLALGLSIPFALASLVIGILTANGIATSLSDPMRSFIAFVLAVGGLILVTFIMLGIRRGWRWLWLTWLLLTLFMAAWLAAFNVSNVLASDYGSVPVVGPVSRTLDSWRSLPRIGRLGRLLESDRGTGRVRVLIWEGALDLISPHDPLQFPNGQPDRFNILRPLIGYGPEAMYVAYNRFYPPELATIEARNASPDRAHNETFDALVITGGLGFLVWQALYLSVFYFGFRWLGVVRDRKDRNLLIAFWVGGAVLATILIVNLLGLPYLGVAIPFGSVGGLALYLIYYALSARPEKEDGGRDPFAVDRLLMTALVAAVIAHYVEIHFGIAIAATRVHFFVFIAVMYLLGYKLPRLSSEPVTPSLSGRKRRSGRSNPRMSRPGWLGPTLLSALMLALMLGIMGYNFVTYSLPPGKEILAATDLTAAEIFHQSLLLNARRDFTASPFVYLMMMLTWFLGSLLFLSEMIKVGELRIGGIANRTTGKRSGVRARPAAAALIGMALATLALRFIGPEPAIMSASLLLGRSLLLLWGGISLWAGVMLLLRAPSAPLLAAAVATIGLVLALPILVAGAWQPALGIAGVSGLALYFLWSGALRELLLPAAVLGLVSVTVGLTYAFLQAVLLRASILLQPSTALETIDQLVEWRVFESDQGTMFLTFFYLFVFTLLFLAAFVLAGPRLASARQTGTTVAYASLVLLGVLAFVAVGRTNIRVIQADMIYKRARPFDNQATSNRDPQLWDTAIAIYENALDYTPKEDFYYLFLGRAYLERSTITPDTGEQAALLSAAEERLLQAQDINPLNTDHTANLARLNTRWLQLVNEASLRQARLEAAEQYYQDALNLSPQNSVIRNEYARLAFDLKQDCDQATELFDQSVSIDPFYAETYFARADVYAACAAKEDEAEREALFQTAVDSLNQGLAIDEENARAWLRAAQVYEQLGQFEAALNAYELAREVDDRGLIAGWEVDLAQASLYRVTGNEELALSLARQAEALAPDTARSQIRLFIAASPLAESVVLTEAVTLPDDRPLAGLPPETRNGYFDAYPPNVIETARSYEAVIRTERGDIHFRLLDDEAPLTVNNFVFLAHQGFYDDTTFHRVIEDFVAQGGDPTGTGTGGPGYQFADEVAGGLSFDRRGLLAMANAGPDTNGSQFFITLVPVPQLNGRHTIFGHLIDGDAVLDRLSLRDPQQDPTETGDRIIRIDILEVEP